MSQLPAISLQEAVEAIQSSLQKNGVASYEHVARVLGSAATTVQLQPRTDAPVANIAGCDLKLAGSAPYWIPGI